MTRRDIEVKRCCSCMFGKRVRMDSNYEYPIQYICKINGDRVYTACHDYPAPIWCPYKLLVDIKNAKELRSKLLEIKERLAMQSKSLIELVRGGELRPPQKINTCQFCLMHYKK